MKRIRTALGALAFVFIIGSAQACADNPTAPTGEDVDTAECWWFDGILHCSG